MAGIGFELRRILTRNTLSTDIAAYGLAGLISSGAWVISILGVLLLGVLVSLTPIYYHSVTQFQVSVTYLIASSLVLSGLGQQSFTRFFADQLFLNRTFAIIPNLNGMTLLTTLVSGLAAFGAVTLLFPAQSIIYRGLFMANFVVLCNIWIATNLLTGLKNYRSILTIFALGYGVTIVLGYTLRSIGLEGFMFSFLAGQLLLLILLHAILYQHYPSPNLIAFDFLRRHNRYPSLIVTSFCYNLGIWIDKAVFWFTASTSYTVLGPLRASLIYDVPIFLAYLALIPGMAVFLLRVETDFAEYYRYFYDAIRNGQTLTHIRMMRDHMISAGQNAIYAIVKVQLVTILVVFLLGARLLYLLHIPVIYKNLLYVDVIGASLQVVFLAILNILFYIDRRKDTLLLCVWFVVLNYVFTQITVHLGPLYYGYGFTIALLCVCTYGMKLLAKEFTDIDYKAIMLR